MDRVFFFEGAVMDGIPVFNLVRETMPAVRIDGFRGVINTTSNFILSALERGQPFDDAVREMQARGIAEADPSLDVDGWDAAAKTAALVNVLMGGAMTPHQVARTGIADVNGRTTCSDALKRGRRIRLVASASRQGGTASSPASNPRCWPATTRWPGSPTPRTRSTCSPTCSARSASCSAKAALTQTAYAVLSDVSRISLRLRDWNDR